MQTPELWTFPSFGRLTADRRTSRLTNSVVAYRRTIEMRVWRWDMPTVGVRHNRIMQLFPPSRSAHIQIVGCTHAKSTAVRIPDTATFCVLGAEPKRLPFSRLVLLPVSSVWDVSARAPAFWKTQARPCFRFLPLTWANEPSPHHRRHPRFSASFITTL